MLACFFGGGGILPPRQAWQTEQESEHPHDQEPTGPSPLLGHDAGSSSQGELSTSCELRGFRPRAVHEWVAHGLAAMSIDTNPKRERGSQARSPRSRFGLVWLVSYPWENRHNDQCVRNRVTGPKFSSVGRNPVLTTDEHGLTQMETDVHSTNYLFIIFICVNLWLNCSPLTPCTYSLPCLTHRSAATAERLPG